MKEFDEYIDAVRTERNLDMRVAILDLRVETRGSRLVILGATTVPEAVEDLVERLSEIKSRKFIKDEVVRLPDESVGVDPHAIVRAALAPVYGDPALPAPQTTQAVLGTRVEPLARARNWCRIRMEDGYIGWVHDGYLQFGDREWAYAWERASKGEPAVSLGAEIIDEDGGVFARLPWGARVIRLSQDHYELPDGRHGSVGSGEIVAANRLADWFPARGDSVTRTARRWVGAPYLWGGVTTGGVDCSGLVQAVFWLHGVALPRDSDMQSRCGEAIDPGESYANLNAGDLLFYSENPGRVNHVAISLGGSHIVHSALTNGGVLVNDMNGAGELEVKLRDVFARAVRLLPD